jgi:hypothetical protein
MEKPGNEWIKYDKGLLNAFNPGLMLKLGLL